MACESGLVPSKHLSPTAAALTRPPPAVNQLLVSGVGFATISRDQQCPHRHLPAPTNQLAPENGRLHWCRYREMVVSTGAGTGNWLPSQPNSSQLPVPRVQSATISRDQPAPHHHLPAPIDQQTPGNGRLHWCRHREMVVSTGAGTEEWSSPLVLVPRNGRLHWYWCRGLLV